MFYSPIVCRVITFTNRLAICVFAHVVLCTVPANADYISSLEPDRSFWSPDCPLASAANPFGNSIYNSGGSGASHSDHIVIYPSAPADPLPPETPIVVLGIPASGTGAGSGSSDGGSGPSTANAVLCWISTLPPPVLVGRIYTVEDLNIPPAPPFELLRPS